MAEGPQEDVRASSRVPAPWHRLWRVIAFGVLALGITIAIVGSLLWHASARTHERQAFQVAATDIAETFEMQLRRDTDFVTTLRGVLRMQPNLGANGFNDWLTALGAHQAPVAGLGTLVVRKVPRADLAAFQARRDSEGDFRELVGGKVTPLADPARKPYYCLLSAGDISSPYEPSIARLLQADWCDPQSEMGSYQVAGTTQARLMQSVARSGGIFVYPVTAEGLSSFFIETALYRPGASLSDEARRVAALEGWVSSSYDTWGLINAGLSGHHDIAVALYHANDGGPSELIGRAGRTSATDPFAQAATLRIDGTWIIHMRGVGLVNNALSADTQALLVLLGGVLVSGLLFALILIQARSREHALGMVHEKTGQLRHQAMHDALTGLPNRVLAIDRAEQMLARARRSHVPVAALYVDIDGFKHVNDTFGHAAGDELLRIVAARLESVVREGDTAARLGGDEFVVLVEGSTLDAGPELVAERLLEVLGQPYDLNGHVGRQLSLTASVGIAAGLRENADELLGDADLALYQAKAAGKNRWVVFHSAMQEAARDRLTIEMDLAEALGRNELFVVYQPTFDLQSGKVIGLEALLRWRHPTRGLLQPAEFIPIAEDSRLIVPIGRWVLHEACRQAGIWRRKGLSLEMAVNVSAQQLDDDGLIKDVREALQASELDAGSLTLEVTETTLMRDPKATADRLRKLKSIGVRIAIDDFGTGYSSLAYLRQFPADALKIDRSFISDIASSAQSTALIHTLVQLGKTLHIETLAEGIEEQVQLETLQRENCDRGQGFLFSRPLPVEEVERFLIPPDGGFVASALKHSQTTNL
jgi:diguanylate cyclase (GGDEF)-like protein